MIQDDIKRLFSYFLSKQGGAIAGSITPSVDLTHSLGSPSKRWKVYHNVSTRVYNSANISINNATVTALTFNSERWDTDDMHSTSTNTSRLTCVVPGMYLIGTTAEFASNATGLRSITIRINGTTYLAGNTVPAVNGSGQLMGCIALYTLAVGNYVETTVYQTSGGALNVSALGVYSPEFWMQLVSHS